jgi:hypothetical protein
MVSKTIGMRCSGKEHTSYNGYNRLFKQGPTSYSRNNKHAGNPG